MPIEKKKLAELGVAGGMQLLGVGLATTPIIWPVGLGMFAAGGASLAYVALGKGKHKELKEVM